MMKLPYWSFLLLAALSLSCRPSTNTGFSIDYEKYSLDNGLEVVFHIDRSDPIVAVAMTYHVGSARERPGKTGFAHLFEHLLFLESENLGKGGLDILINKVGGTLNGSTNRDRTNYYQVVPNDALEKILWAEADKLGFFINTVTAPVVEKEKQVVKNEKRQGVDNRPYGHTNYVIDKNLYPEGHPYNWQVIGSLEDLQNASLEDVHEFYRAWYAPNNATLVLAGDFDVVQAKEWVEKYFGEIPAVELHPQDPVEQPTLTETTRLFHEDNFARLPALTIAWPTVAQYHPDTYPLQLLSLLLTDGKKAPFYKVLVEDRQLTSNVSMFNQNSELAGKTTLSIRAFAGTDLDEVDAAVNEAFARFETDGFTEADLARVKARVETSFYNGMASVLGKAFRLAQYNIFAGDPGYAAEDIQRLLDVTHEDVLRVYDHYIKDKHYICTSFVPRGQTDLMLAESRQAEVVEEQIIAGAEEEFLLTGSGPIEKTPSSFDRSIEPSFGSSPEISIPEIWTDHLDNGMRLFGIENDELPLVQFTLRMRGGLLLDNPDKIGVANMVTDVMMEGTRTKTPEELEAAIDELGASISIQAGRETITVRGNTLARNYEQTMALVEEILLEPRWDEKEFDLVKQRTLDNLRQQAANPNAIAANVYNKLLYGEDHIFSNNILGTIESVESINIDDLQAFYERTFSPTLTVMHVVGNVNQQRVRRSVAGLNERWEQKDVAFPQYDLPNRTVQSRIYFVDVPNAKQSVIRVGYLALAQTDEAYYPATVMNFRLGGGGFASQMLQTLREQKGYTYGAGSFFSGTTTPGPFTVATSVRSNVTYESASLIKEILENYEAGFNETDLEATRNFLLRSNARAFETLGAKINMLQNISAYDFPYDYVLQRESIVREMTVERIKELAQRHIDASRMIYLVVGDAKTQLEHLADMGFGQPILLDHNATPLQ